MKKIFIIIITLLILPCFCVTAAAEDSYSGQLFDFFDSSVKDVLEDFGISYENGSTVWDISPEKALRVVADLFTDGFSSLIGKGISCISLVLTVSLFSGFIPEKSGLYMMSKSVCLMSVMFLTVSFSAEVFTDCCSGLLVTRDFMLVLVPVFGGVVSFSGNPALALSFNSVVLAFAEAVALAFEGIVPTLSAVLMCISCAGAVNPFMRLDAVTRLITKALSLFMAFVAGIFVAVLSIRGVISGAADSVTIRGLRFLIGNSVPVVGSAIGEALNSIVAGLGLIKNTVGMLGIAGVIAINLPALINILVCKGILYVISVTADISGESNIRSFSSELSGVLSLIAGAVCFISFVFIISIAIIITISRS